MAGPDGGFESRPNMLEGKGDEGVGRGVRGGTSAALHAYCRGERERDCAGVGDKRETGREREYAGGEDKAKGERERERERERKYRAECMNIGNASRNVPV